MSGTDNTNPIQDKSKTWEQWNIEEVYGWAKNQSDGEDYAQALKDQSIKGQFLKNLTFARLTQSDGPYKFKDGSAYSLLESIEKLTKNPSLFPLSHYFCQTYLIAASTNHHHSNLVILFCFVCSHITGLHLPQCCWSIYLQLFQILYQPITIHITGYIH
ncbi:hypothetical protein DFA_06173 [Cavenderia fasciculata]|uniref:SAM domain-containing protein n=1 Tax=Cavenderia fasciculata TaxID=261658 RepID=F4PKB1_CACFS|nr:uncharacterized protein DFA_06173 [Cavenderia fasciculata]EGG24035.1 hypothetical protein DFA_06173 [Cavenderia fasciculata]|eukprot:XP_004361886.1 hypothetical protein DFA_06173 [Cavenderia fasciculata]